jgi:uncharacterized membrane protein
MIEENTLNREKQRWLNRRISVLLRVGVYCGLVIILAGLVVMHILPSQPSMSLIPISALPAEFARLNSLALITTGILVVLALPVIVIIMAFIFYINIRERRMIIICSVLLIMLIFSFIYALK